MYVCVCVSVCVRVRLPRDVRGLAHGVDPAVDLTWAIVDSGNYGPGEARGHTWMKLGPEHRIQGLLCHCLRCCDAQTHPDSQLNQVLLRCLRCFSVAAKGMLRKPDTISPKTNIGKADTLALANTMMQALKTKRLPEGALLRPRQAHECPRCEQCSTLPE